MRSLALLSRTFGSLNLAQTPKPAVRHRTWSVLLAAIAASCTPQADTPPGVAVGQVLFVTWPTAEAIGEEPSIFVVKEVHGWSLLVRVGFPVDQPDPNSQPLIWVNMRNALTWREYPK